MRRQPLGAGFLASASASRPSACNLSASQCDRRAMATIASAETTLSMVEAIGRATGRALS